MKKDWKMSLYWRLPVAVQEAGLSLYARHLSRLYYGGNFESECREIRAARWTSAEDVRAWQVARLRGLLEKIAPRVPYYRRTLRGTAQIRSLSDLERLPMLDRQEIRGRETDFLDPSLDPRRLFKDKTSGSTGTSVTVYWPPDPLRRLQAVIEVRVRNAAGVSLASPRAMVGGRPIVRGDSRRPPYWRWNGFWKQLYLSSYHISKTTAPLYVTALRRSGVEWMTGYGSAIAALAESAAAAGVAPVPMKCVIVSGDTLQPGMRRSIETFFQCRCYDHYGQVEGVAMAMECGAGRLHVVPEVGILEVVRGDGRACEPGEVGEIVATGLLNDGMPFVRYRTGDSASYAVDQRCACGSPQPVIEALEGRVDDYLVTSDGRRIGRLSTAMKRSPSIHSAQIVQDRPGHAFLLVRPGDGFQAKDAIPVKDDVLERIGAFDLDIREVVEIPKTPTGKTRLVVRLNDRPDLRPHYAAILGSPADGEPERRAS
jgi:phenylacetate-CoA ligase